MPRTRRSVVDGTVAVLTSPRTARRLENLLMRYEEPSSMVRWDSPLFTVPWTDDDVPIDDIWKAITEGNLKPPNAGTQAVNADSSITLDIESHN